MHPLRRLRLRQLRARTWLFAPLALIFTILFALPPAAFAQGTAADHRRATMLESLYREARAGREIAPIWTPEGDLIARRFGARGTIWFERITRATRERAPAFDHAFAAEKISEILGRSVAENALPIDRIYFSGGATCLLVAGHALRVEGDGTLVELSLDSPHGPPRLASTAARTSRNGGTETSILFVNQTDETLTLDWIDRDGKQRHYGTLDPGAQRRQHTFSGHLWAVGVVNGGLISRYLADADPCLVIIDSTEPEPTITWGQTTRPEFSSGLSTISPDGLLRVTRHDDDLWLRDELTGREELIARASNLTGRRDPTAPRRFSEGLWWSPDSSHVAFLEEIPAESHSVFLIESSPPDRLEPRLHTLQYLKPGDRIAKRRPFIYSVSEKRAVAVDDVHFENPWSITQIAWDSRREELTFVADLRGHQGVRWIAARPDGSTRKIIDETTDTFIDYSSKRFLRTIRGGTEAIWMSERSGWNQLWRIEVATGKVLGSITGATEFGGEWVVRAVESVDDEAETILFRAMGVFPDQDPYHVHYGRVRFDGTGLVWLTEGDGTHSIEFSPDGETYLDTYSRVDLPPIVEWRQSVDGALITQVTAADIRSLRELGWRAPERFSAKGRDGETDIWGVIFTPSNLDRTKRYPVIEQIYAGPHGHFVPKSFRPWHDPRALAELGFIVVQIDGMGTNWRSKAFHDVAWQNLGDSGFPDRIAWLRAAAKTRPYLDLDRVGIYGGSAGGQSALRALLAHGDFYDAAVADCGCHDNRMDKVWWNEQWMGWPVGPHYAEQSNVTNAHRLEGDLLLIVGELDRNVDPASTMQVVDALIRADKDFDMLVIPGAGHGAGASPYGVRRTHDFFLRKLWGVEPRRVE